jgi:hypothetical protein
MAAGEKDCIWCGETIKASARICRFCNRSQSEEPAPDTSPVAERAPESESADADEEVFYDGPAFLEPEVVVKWAPLALFAIGLFPLAWYWFIAQNTRYLITTRQIRVETKLPWLNRVDTMDARRIRDVRFASSYGLQSITVLSTDRSHPELRLSFSGARAVYDRLNTALLEPGGVSGTGTRDAGAKS